MTDRTHLLWIVLPVLPVLLGFAVLNILNDGTMMLYYHLPLSVVADAQARDLISDFAQGMTLFWGIVFSLTLLAVFGPGHLLLSQALAAEADVKKDLRDHIAEQGAYRQAKRVLTTLAPLLVGSSASILNMFPTAWVG